MLELLFKLLFVGALVLAQAGQAKAQDDVDMLIEHADKAAYADGLNVVFSDNEEGQVVFLVAVDDGYWWVEEECADSAGCSVGIVIYDSADPDVLDIAVLTLLLERPWLEQTILAMCPPSVKCDMYYVPDEEGIAGDGWSEPVFYYPDDTWPLEAALVLLFEKEPNAMLEVAGLCPCSLED